MNIEAKKRDTCLDLHIVLTFKSLKITPYCIPERTEYQLPSAIQKILAGRPMMDNKIASLNMIKNLLLR